MPRAPDRRILDPGEAEREVPAFDGLVEIGPLHLDEPGGAALPTEPAGDALGDFDIEAPHAGRIGRIRLHEWRAPLGVTAPHELAAARALRSEGRGEAECEPGNAERAGSDHGV